MNPDEDVELGAQVEARARGTVGAVVAVRVPRDLLAGISEYAKLRGLTVAEVMREGAERLVGGTVQPTHYVSGAQSRRVRESFQDRRPAAAEARRWTSMR